MDAKDVRIFCEMAFGTPNMSVIRDRHASPSEIGKKVGLDEKTVRLRLKKMENEGFIKYYQVVPNLSLFGLKRIDSYRFEALNLATKHNLVDYLNETPSIVEAFDYLGQTVVVTIAGMRADDIQSRIDVIASRFELSKRHLFGSSIKETRARLDRLDWQIVRGLRYSARRSTIDLAKALSITPRMTEYRVSRLFDSDALILRAAIDPTKQQGLVFFELELTAEKAMQSEVNEQLADAFNEKVWSIHPSSERTLVVRMFGFSLGEPEDAALKASRFRGVRSCSLYIMKEMIEPRGPNWVDELINREISAAN